ncbi:gamma-glutamylcyclotransferase [Paraburkholderia sp. BCC1885]|uniref:gamma-glutamylcyclotransferase n=1 Tax=Paraburkholderia sp. BCC1885 TaxID=2562669 RepID=UPI001642CFB8|nr:gamma-glutamylcyclotransferase [Paraburkholderia sp. BCC1885]
MWIFGYGSLMTDGWEGRYGCAQRVVAELHGYRRAFSKASVVNWGTRACPCPTLNLESREDALCIGVAFKFPETRRSEVETYLAKREGKSFMLSSLEIIVKEEGPIQALVPLYTGKNILPSVTTRELVASIRQARGTSGACSDYVVDVHEQLAKLGIDDPAVTQLQEHLLALGCGNRT